MKPRLEVSWLWIFMHNISVNNTALRPAYAPYQEIQETQKPMLSTIIGYWGVKHIVQRDFQGCYMGFYK